MTTVPFRMAIITRIPEADAPGAADALQTAECAVVVRAAAGPRGRTVIEELAGAEPWRPSLLARPGGDGVARVALVQTRASLIAGDDIRLSVAVGAGAQLEIVELGAVLAHHVRGGPGSVLSTDITVAGGGALVWLGQPLIAGAGCRTVRTTSAAPQTGARLLLGEGVVFGRTGQQPGTLVARTRITYQGRPVVDETLDTGDLDTLRSPVVVGPARLISALTLVGVRDDDPLLGAMQAHEPATLWRTAGGCVEVAAAGARVADRWMTLALPCA